MSEAAARPQVTVFDAGQEGEVALKQVPLPAVLQAPIRPDVVARVHKNVAKNRRQAYSVKWDAGMEYAAESWGTGRAVSRIPRVPGGGTHRAGQGAFGNMCRGGRMFAPTRVWRRWHRHVNKNERRYAVASALAASALPALVMARGHRVERVPEMPLVIGGDALGDVTKTSAALKLLEKFGATKDTSRVVASKKIRSGKGKMRNRRYKKRRGPLIIHASTSPDMVKAFRNVEGVDNCHVDRLNILSLAPGGHLGRFCIWTEDAFQRLDALFGTHTDKSTEKNNYVLPKPVINNADVTRIINSDEIQNVVRDPKTPQRRNKRKKNPLRNLGAMIKLNPYAQAHRRAEIAASKQKAAKKKKEGNSREARRAFYQKMLS